MIVSFSGIDSAGKTTQINRLCDYCSNNGIKYIKKWSKARGTPLVVFLKSIVRRDKSFSDDQKAEYRKEVFNNTKKEKLLYIASMLDLCLYWGFYFRLKGLFCDILICDRYIWDTYVEVRQDFKGINLEQSLLWKLVTLCTPTPKVSFVFVIPAELSLQRDLMKGTDGTEDIERKKAKIADYMSLVDRQKWTNVMDGTRTIEELHTEVVSILKIN